MKKPFIVLGIYEVHNASACLMIDGKIIAASHEERFSKIKNDVGMPIKAAKFVDTIWDSNRVELWWNKKRTQDAIKIFCKYFAKDNKYLIQNLNKIFRERTNRSW